MKTIRINVADKKATCENPEVIICGNADYQVEFIFDEEWNAHAEKVARFIANGKIYDVPFTGNTCKMPIISKVTTLEVGVYVENELATVTLLMPCELSVRCKTSAETFIAPTIPEYNGEYELLVPTVSGVWVFNETIPMEDTSFSNISFSNGGRNFDSILIENAKPWSMVYRNSSDEVGAYWEGDGWLDEAYRTIDFGTTAQEVSEEFYAWLTANAVKQ